ncbi:hypothetical protein K7X08_028283 [Anisodus acutangulus]|uniref:IBR domain-containing protein n=1 Tax=Anisodus acutangulus TaxID=402998 RepID=A0A9Q1M670_9SOLA|nr:hypothetical protein K7X08_028283 [Anisodus acutangulus]
MDLEDLKTLAAEQRRELMAACDVDSDFDFTFQLQLQEALNASISLQPSTSTTTLPNPEPNDVVSKFDVQTSELLQLEREIDDRKLSELEFRKMRDDLQRRIHDHRVPQEILRMLEDEWLDNGDNFEVPFGEECNSDLKLDSCSNFLTPKLIDIMKQRINEASIPVTEKVYCPYPKCSALMSKSEVLEYSKVSFLGAERIGIRKCTKCNGLFCVNCKVPWHYNIACDEYRRRNPNPPEDVNVGN